MRTLLAKESCVLCYTFLKECKETVSCQLIENKQRGGLICPLVDIVYIIKMANRGFDLATKSQGIYS